MQPKFSIAPGNSGAATWSYLGSGYAWPNCSSKKSMPPAGKVEDLLGLQVLQHRRAAVDAQITAAFSATDLGERAGADHGQVSAHPWGGCRFPRSTARLTEVVTSSTHN